MQRFKNWLITRLCKKDKLVCVPQSWQDDYVKVCGDNANNQAVIADIINEYNILLKDFFNKNSVTELRTLLKDNEVEFKTTDSKERLVELAYNDFKMNIEH